jgi:hypothetical protein
MNVLTIFSGHPNALIQKLLKNYFGMLNPILGLMDGMVKHLLNAFDHGLRPVMGDVLDLLLPCLTGSEF